MLEPTEYLRLVNRPVPAPGWPLGQGRYVLQQWWQSTQMIPGKGEWRDVPVLPEDDTPPVTAL